MYYFVLQRYNQTCTTRVYPLILNVIIFVTYVCLS